MVALQEKSELKTSMFSTGFITIWNITFIKLCLQWIAIVLSKSKEVNKLKKHGYQARERNMKNI